MRVEVKVPQLPESVAEATLVSWHRKAGESVQRDENLIEVETDKVVLELPAPASGVLVEILKPDGSTVAGQEAIAVIDTEAVATAVAAPPTANGRGAGGDQRCRRAERPRRRPHCRRRASSWPSKASAAAEVQGSGRGGRITKGDVVAAGEAKVAPPKPAAQPTAQPAAQTGGARGRPALPRSGTAPSSGCRCRGCASGWPNGSSPRRRPRRSSPRSTKSTCSRSSSCATATRTVSRRSTASSWASWASS